MVRWSDDTATHTVTIQHVDPDASVGRLSLAFRMPDGPLDASELPGLGDFTVLSESYYDSSGLPMTGVSATKTGIR
jgi:hypothetical protein